MRVWRLVINCKNNLQFLGRPFLTYKLSHLEFYYILHYWLKCWISALAEVTKYRTIVSCAQKSSETPMRREYTSTTYTQLLEFESGWRQQRPWSEQWFISSSLPHSFEPSGHSEHKEKTALVVRKINPSPTFAIFLTFSPRIGKKRNTFSPISLILFTESKYIISKSLILSTNA